MRVRNEYSLHRVLVHVVRVEWPCLQVAELVSASKQRVTVRNCLLLHTHHIAHLQYSPKTCENDLPRTGLLKGKRNPSFVDSLDLRICEMMVDHALLLRLKELLLSLPLVKVV